MSDVFESRRTHDREIYIKEDRYNQPKEYFLKLKEFLEKANLPGPGARIGDFGCATGEFLYFMRNAFPHADYRGFDVVPELLEKARQRVPGVDFCSGSVTDAALLPPESLDIAFMMGVHSIFDEVEPWLKNLLSWVRPKGRIYVFGLFNDFPVDVLIKYRDFSGQSSGEEAFPSLIQSPWESGWNVFSKKHVTHVLNNASVQSHNFHRFEMPFDLPPHAGDPLRTWTMQDNQGSRWLTNGLNLLCPFSFLEIVR